ncbi:HNH endonuclease signature motif containing protein [Corynebacterium sp. NPDC060344]|uniref:HNH endonuclease signature motif containing protein n=1 Tax=Corynebacterium sp. NPDC060344 TaxID=3347101 RepID=UPI0036589753
MAFDHDAADEHDDPDHHYNQHEQHRQRPPYPDDGRSNEPASDPESEPGPDSESEPLPPPRKRWATERDESVTNLGRARNIANVEIAVAVTPDGDADVDSHAAAVGVRLGMTKFKAGPYCDVGIMFRRMPRVLEFSRSGALPHDHLLRIAEAIVAVSDDTIAEVEARILDYLRPTKDLQALPGIRTLANALRLIVEEIEPISTPPDEEEKKSLEAEKVTIVNDYPCDFAAMEVCLRKDRMAEFEATIRAIRDAKIKAGVDCTLADALMAMSRGDFAGAKVTMNVYADANANFGDGNGDGDGSGDGDGELRLWLDGAGWLPKYLTKQWLERCDDVRLSADSQVDGYVPSDAQKARVRARDGGCRFPGCDVPAHRCQIDHVINYDPDAMKGAPGMVIGGGTCEGDAAGGAAGAAFIAGDTSNLLGVTATWNLQCLCQHHHNLKTSRHWNAVMNDDGSVDWFDHTGAAFATSVPHGPIAHIKRQTFDQRATRLAKTIRGANAHRMRADAEAAEAMRNADVTEALAKHARETVEYEQAMAEYTAGPLNDPDPEVAEEARCLADAADDGWPCADDELWSRQSMAPRVWRRRSESVRCHRARVDADPSVVPVPPAPLGPDPTIPF